jgi:pantothenate synthetase
VPLFLIWIGHVVGEEGSIAIASAVAGHTRLVSLTVDHVIPVMDCLTQGSLHLCGRGLSAADAVVISSFLRMNSVLTALDLGCMQFFGFA